MRSVGDVDDEVDDVELVDAERWFEDRCRGVLVVVASRCVRC